MTAEELENLVEAIELIKRANYKLHTAAFRKRLQRYREISNRKPEAKE